MRRLLLVFSIILASAALVSAADWSIKSLDKGNCPKCKPGEYMVTQYDKLPATGQQIQGSNDPPCGADPNAQITNLRNELNKSANKLGPIASGLGGIAAIGDAALTEVDKWVKNQGGFIAKGADLLKRRP